MEKKRLFKILSKAESEKVAELGKKIRDKYPVTVIKKPEKTLFCSFIIESATSKVNENVLGRPLPASTAAPYPGSPLRPPCCRRS